MNATRSAVRLVHVRLNLEYKRGEMRVERVDHTDVSGTRGRRRRHLQELFQERLNTEVSQRGTENTGDSLPSCTALRSNSSPAPESSSTSSISVWY